MRCAINLCGLVKFTRNGVEETKEQEGVRTQCATEVDADQAELRVQAQNREDILNSQQEQEQSHECQHLGEHLNQKQEGQGSATTSETEATEGVGSSRTHENCSNCCDVETTSELKIHCQYMLYRSEPNALKLSKEIPFDRLSGAVKQHSEQKTPKARKAAE